MEDNSGRIFLTEQEAKQAIGLDFQQYGTQSRLFHELSPLILGQTVIPLGGPGHTGMWIRQKTNNHMRRIKDDELGELLCETLAANDYPLSLLAGICSRTFQVKARPGVKPGTTIHGIWIESDMDNFQCAQCGHCCQDLCLENECTHEDYFQWQSLGLDHILQRVLVLDRGTRGVRYKIWIEPGTGELSPVCPWLVPTHRKDRFICTIQDVKPEICRQYPLTRKHARMTGCKGSFKQPTGNAGHGN